MFALWFKFWKNSTLNKIIQSGELSLFGPGYMPLKWKIQKGNIIGYDVDMAQKNGKRYGC